MKFTVTTNSNGTQRAIVKTADLKGDEIISFQHDDIIECYAALGADVSVMTAAQKKSIRAAAAK